MKLLTVALAATALLGAAPAVSLLPFTDSGAVCAQREGCNPDFPKDPNYYTACHEGCDPEPFSVCWSDIMIIPAEDFECAEPQYGCEV